MDVLVALTIVDEEIEELMKLIDRQVYLNTYAQELRENIEELKIQAYQYRRKYEQLLKRYNRLDNFVFLNTITELVNFNLTERQSDVSEEFLRMKLLCAGVEHDIALHDFELGIVQGKLNAQQNLELTLKEKINHKETLIRKSKRLDLTEYSAFALKINELNRQLKFSKHLRYDAQEVISSMKSLQLACSEIARALNQSLDQKFYPTYYQSKKLKWIARKSTRLKIELEKYISQVKHHIAEEEFNDIHLKIKHYLDFYIDNLIKDLKSTRLTSIHLHNFFMNLMTLIEKTTHALNRSEEARLTEIEETEKEREQWVLNYRANEN